MAKNKKKKSADVIPLSPIVEKPASVAKAEQKYRAVVEMHRTVKHQLKSSYEMLREKAKEESVRNLPKPLAERDRALADIVKMKADTLSKLKHDEEREVRSTVDAVRGKYKRLRELEIGRTDKLREEANAAYDAVLRPAQEALAVTLKNLDEWYTRETTEADRIYAEKQKLAMNEVDEAKRAEAERQSKPQTEPEAQPQSP